MNVVVAVGSLASAAVTVTGPVVAGNMKFAVARPLASVVAAGVPANVPAVVVQVIAEFGTMLPYWSRTSTTRGFTSAVLIAPVWLLPLTTTRLLAVVALPVNEKVAARA